MIFVSTETQLCRSRPLADIAGVVPANAEVVTITTPANALLVLLVLQFVSSDNGQAKR